MNVLKIGLFLFITICSTQAQPVSKAIYLCTTNIDKGKVHDGINTLYFSPKKALYVHNGFPTKDEYKEQSLGTHFVKGDSEGLPIFFDLEEKSITYKSDYKAIRQLFIFNEDLPKISWEISTKIKTIGSIQATRATGSFGGRIYDVWFSSEIAVPFGPYKLFGLPGLILEAKSRDGRVTYELVSYTPVSSDDIQLERPKVGREITWEEFRQFVINQLLKVESLSTADMQMTNNDPSSDWEIEKDKFTIITEYKKKRSKGDY